MLEMDFGWGGWKRPPAPALLSQKPWKSRLSRCLMFDAAPPPGRVRLLLASDGAAAFRAVLLPVAAGSKGLSAPFAGPCTLPVNVGVKCLVGGQNRPPKVLAQQRIGNHLHTHTRSPRHRPTADSCHRRSWRTAAGSADYSVPFGRASGV